MRALAARLHDVRLARRVVPGLWVDDRLAGFGVDPRRPTRRHKVFARDELAGLGIEHVEEAVLGSVHQHAARLTGDLQVGEHQRRSRVEVPLLARSLLVMPHVLAGVGVQRDDGSQKEVVPPTLSTVTAIPGRTVTGAEVHEVQPRIVDDPVPDGAAAAQHPPVPAPGFGRGLQRLHVRGLGRIARHRIEPPGQFASLGVKGRDVTTHSELAAGVADDDLAFEDARPTGAGDGLVVIERKGLPHDPARLGIQRKQPAVIRADIDLAVPRRQSPVDDVAAAATGKLAGDFRIERPQQLAGAGVERFHLAPGSGNVQDAIDGQRCGFLAAVGVEVRKPGKTQPGDRLGVDLSERTEALLIVGSTYRHPLVRLPVGCGETSGSDGCGRLGRHRVRSVGCGPQHRNAD